ncbi:hypothetical protein HJG60_008594 [Phyllostomus discolor]|uniref:Uncharacterized protein n=1 Tax=Phyllostomus discolor TaxID=89673 RepID=A0A833YSX1_9CHIR|nr:hypothetical protein HJG60_008594 [Phyllostomus discolor]
MVLFLRAVGVYTLSSPRASPSPRAVHGSLPMAVIFSAPPQPHGSPPQWPPNLGFKSLWPIFLCSPISDSSHTRLHMPELISFQLYWAAIMSLGRCGPMSWSQSSLSSHADAVMQGTRPPPQLHLGGEVTSIPLA